MSLRNESLSSDDYANHAYGKRPIHKASSTCTSVQHFQDLIKHIPPEVITDEVLKITNEGETVFDLIKENNYLWNQKIKDELITILISYALKKTVSPLDELFTDSEKDQLKRELGIEPGSEEESSFDAAVHLVNLTRSSFRYSTTHPQINGSWRRNNVQKEVNKMIAIRHYYDHRINEILYSQSKITIERESANSITFKIVVNEENGFQENEDMILNTGYGNCLEMARFAHRVGQSRNLRMTSYAISRGDHVFTTVGEMVCDPWAKKVFRFSQIGAFLGDFKSINHQGEKYNFIFKYEEFQGVRKKHFASTHKRQKLTINFSNTFADRIIQRVLAQLKRPEDKFLFAVVIRDNLIYALEQHVFSEDDFDELDYRLESNLRKYFSSDINHFPLLASKYKDYEPLFHLKLRAALDQDLIDIDDTQSEDGKTPLYIATSLGYVSIVEMLLSRDADQNIATEEGYTAIFRAAASGFEDIVDLLLSKPDTELLPVINAAKVFREFVNTNDTSILRRLECHIESQKQQGVSKDSISITPAEIAYIMGHDSIAFKLKKCAEAQNQSQKLSKPATGLFSPAQVVDAPCLSDKSEVEQSSFTDPKLDFLKNISRN